VILDGRDVTHMPPHLRDIGMVFQNYALFPHLTVARNLAFPLEMRHLPRSEINRKVESALDLVRLAGYGDRRPRELSGGQQQRVALARALVFGPRLLLMDEPLGALDRKLRETMQIEIINICQEMGHTVLYVTHDQEEALAMSSRIAIYHDGRIEQVGTPEDIYQRPVSLFVATFIGESTTFLGHLQRNGNGACLVSGGLNLPVGDARFRRLGMKYGAPAALVVRPESIAVRLPGSLIHPSDEAKCVTVRGRTQNCVYLGSVRKSVIELADGNKALVRVAADAADDAVIEPGGEVDVCWDMEAGIVVPRESNETASPDLPDADDRSAG
jgi:putative spermidine/putrescine transport system ATP-binding protein